MDEYEKAYGSPQEIVNKIIVDGVTYLVTASRKEEFKEFLERKKNGENVEWEIYL